MKNGTKQRDRHTKPEMEEALKQLDSLLSKTEKVIDKLKEGSSQHTLSARRILAYRLAIALIEEKLEEPSQD